jgi:hypothetical protein
MSRLQDLARYLVESLPALGMNGMVAGVALPAPDGCIDVQRIKLNPAADTSGPLGRNQGGS